MSSTRVWFVIEMLHQVVIPWILDVVAYVYAVPAHAILLCLLLLAWYV
jgi:hypothetical protein